MSEFELFRRLKELLKRKGKTVREFEDESESCKERKEEFEDREFPYFLFHDWSEDVERIVQEHQAKQLQSEYDTLKAIHDYSGKLEALQEHLEMEKQGQTALDNEIGTEEGVDIDYGLEVELNSDAIESMESLSEGLRGSSNSEGANSELSPGEANLEVGSLGSEAELGSGEGGESASGSGSSGSSGADGGSVGGGNGSN